jgi:two-component system response regulator AtoC
MRVYRILVVDEENEVLEVCAETLGGLGATEVVTECDGLRAGERLSRERFDLLVTDTGVSCGDGTALVLRARREDPDLSVIAMTDHASDDASLGDLGPGPLDCLGKPFYPDHLRAVVRRVLEELRLRDENRVLRRHLERDFEYPEIVGGSPGMRAVMERIERAAATDRDVLIVGEAGTGKERVARRIHRRSGRGRERFVPVHCGTIPATLVEGEILGIERSGRPASPGLDIGLVEFADGGTLFLDEVTEIPLSMQARLVEVAARRRLRRVGGTEEIPIDVRIVASTGQDVQSLVREGRFLDEFARRLSTVRIDLPALRDRIEDVRPLVDHFVECWARENGREAPGFCEEAIEVLECYPWPGNVRELRDVVRGSVARARGRRVDVEDLPGCVVRSDCLPKRRGNGFFRLREEHVRRFEREYFGSLLARHRGDVGKAASEARVPRSTLDRLLRELGIEPAEFRR